MLVFQFWLEKYMNVEVDRVHKVIGGLIDDKEQDYDKYCQCIMF